MLQHGAGEEQQAEEGVGAQEEQLAAVVVPVGPRQVARRVVLLLRVQLRRLQPVGSAGEATPKAEVGFKTPFSLFSLILASTSAQSLTGFFDFFPTGIENRKENLSLTSKELLSEERRT